MNDKGMSTVQPKESVELIVSEAINRHLGDLAADLSRDPLPSPNQLERMEVLSRLRDSLVAEAKPPSNRRRIFGISVVLFIIAVLLCLAFWRVGSSAADFNVDASNVEVDFAGGGDSLLIPGEFEEAVQLSRAEVSGIETANLPPEVESGDTLQLEAVTQASGGTSTTLPIGFQQLSLPQKGGFSLNLDTAYGSGSRGIVLSTNADQTSTAHLNAPLPLNAAAATGTIRIIPAASKYRNEPMLVTGRKLRLELYPAKTQGSITVLRNVEVKAIRFQTAEPDHGTSVLGGSLFVRDLGEHPFSIQQGDELEVIGAPLRIRQLIFKNGQFQVSLSSPKSSKIRLGVDPPRNLMPTVFERLSARWPTQLYATLSAIVLLWLAFEKWWRGAE